MECILIEGGGYLTTVREKEAADKKQAECEEMIINLLFYLSLSPSLSPSLLSL
jgi:hypothetical protein